MARWTDNKDREEDSFWSSDLFQIKIGKFCDERDIKFHSFNLSEEKKKKKNLKTLLREDQMILIISTLILFVM